MADAASFLDKFRCISENGSNKLAVSWIRITPIGLSTRWRVSPDILREIGQKGQSEATTNTVSDHGILYRLYESTRAANTELLSGLNSNNRAVRTAFALDETESRSLGDLGHGILRTVLFDAIAWATIPFTPKDFTHGQPHKQRSTQKSKTAGRVVNAYNAWDETVANFIAAWEPADKCDEPSPSEIPDIVSSLLKGAKQVPNSVSQTVKCNFCIASLGLMIILAVSRMYRSSSDDI